MNVKTRPTLTGMLAVAAAGIFAAGTVGDRASSLYGESAAEPAPARHVYAAIDTDCTDTASPGCADDQPLD